MEGYDTYVFTIKGQVCGGKNNIGITKTGKRFPNKKFVEYRKDALVQLHKQLVAPENAGYKTLGDKRAKWLFSYTPVDNRRRDATAILDGLFHIFEHTSPPMVMDDKLIKNFTFEELPADGDNPRVTILIAVPKANG
jgi:hypothetical protein